MTLQSGEVLEYSYGSTRELTSVQYSNSDKLEYLYDLNGQLSGVIDERGTRYSTFAYHDDGKTSLSEHASGADRYTFTYSGLTSTVTNSLGKVSEYVFEEVQGAPKLKTSDRLSSPYCGAASSSYEYDSNGFVSSKTDWEGNVTTYESDSRGLPGTTTYAQGTSEERIVTTQCHTEYRLPEVVTEPGRQMKWSSYFGHRFRGIKIQSLCFVWW